MLFFQRRSRFWHPKYLLFLACLLLAGMGLAAGNGKTKGPEPLPLPAAAMDNLLRGDPSFVYPDAQRMKDVSGHLTAIFKAQGRYTFHSQTPVEKKTCTTQVSLDLTMTVEYIRSGSSELMTGTVQGVKTTIEDSPFEGKNPKIYHYGTGSYYRPSNHRVTTETYTGATTRKAYGAVKSVIWSKEQKLACFRIGLGDMQDNILKVPAKIHVEDDEAIDDDHHRQSWDAALESMAYIPSHSTANTRFAHLVNNRGGLLLEMLGGWLETASPQGTTNGSFTMPLFFDGITWRTEESYQEGGLDPRRVPERNAQLIWPGSIQVIWAFGDQMTEGKMTIAAADQATYTAWYPIPVDDERYGLAAKLEFIARIEPKEKGRPTSGGQLAPKGKIHFWLNDVSRSKGKCSNFPVAGAAKDDLRFAPNQAGLMIDPANPRHAYTEKICAAATVEVEALDTGAYGSLQATCDDLGLVAEDERTRLQSIAIPMDDNHNHIADAWEKSMGVYQKNYLATDDDDNQPANQRRGGDGYTVYEEYRGFMTLAGFVRANPLKKDLFVYDPDGLVKQWYEPYNPAKLVLHFIDPTMMKFNGNAQDPENRRVNGNSSEDQMYARQYAMFVKQWATMSDGVVGEASDTVLADLLNNISDQGDAFDQPLKKFYVVKVAPGTLEKRLAGISDLAVKQDIYTKVMATTVIHEMGHAMGIRHHREGGQETDASISGGVFDCAMRYNIEAEYKHSKLLKEQTRYCVKGETWQKATADGFADLPSDDCFGQIDVKSDP